MTNCKAAPRAFTLIELLVVVITIGILASLAVPRFIKTIDERYRREAKDTLYELLAADGAYRQEHGKYSPNIAELPMQNPNNRTNYPLAFRLDQPTPGTTTTVFRAQATYNRKSPAATSTLVYDPTLTPPGTFGESGW